MWKVIGLTESGSSRVRWCECAHTDREGPWRTVWRYRHEITSPLADWLLGLSEEPTEALLLDRIDGKGFRAGRICRAVAESVGTDLNRFRWQPGLPGRPVVWVQDGQLRFFRSESDLARTMGVSRVRVVWLRLWGLGVLDGIPRL